MRMNFKTMAALVAVAVGFTGCTEGKSADSGDVSASSASGDSTEIQEAAVSTPMENPDNAEDNSVKISLTDSGITAEGSGAEVSGNTVTITASGVYSLSGESSDVKILVDAGKDSGDVTLVLNGADLKNSTGCVIDCESAGNLVIVAAENTENSISDSESYAEIDDGLPDAAVFSRSDLEIKGDGKLTVTGGFKDGIKCKDGLVISGGDIEVTAKDDGITGKDFVKVTGGNITVNSGKDGIKSSNDTDEGMGYVDISGESVIGITAANDGIQAESDITISGGRITAETGGEEAHATVVQQPENSPFDRDQNSEDTESMKGIKAGGSIGISGGEITLVSADDAVHSNENVNIKGGTLILSSCDDGIHADEILSIEGGTVTVKKSYEGLEGKNIEISGGTIDVTAEDDGLNAAGGDNGQFFGYTDSADEYYISVSGGNITVNANGDGIDSNGTIAQSGGVIVVYGPTSRNNGAIDYEKSYAVSGGTLIALGSQGMAQAPSTLSQPCISIYAEVEAGSEVSVKDSEGNVILSTTTPKDCSSLIFTCEKLKAGSDYGVYAGSELLAEVTADEGVSGGGATGDGMGGFGGGMGGHGGRGDPGNRPGNTPGDTRSMGGFAFIY